MLNLPKFEFHILQSFPVTCLNRDDIGSPKTANIGGVVRARVSSQCWKRAIRLKLHELGGKIGVRTENLSKLLIKRCESLSLDKQKVETACQKLAAQVIPDKAIIFVTEDEINALVNLLQENDFSEKIKLDDFLKERKKKKINLLSALDIALFGRMVAKAPDLNVEAACCVAHAITTHKAETELDFFTAVADDSESTGSAFMGVGEFNSGTYYRYVSLDLNQLAQSLAITELDESSIQDLQNCIKYFVQALFLAVPPAKQHTHAGLCVWDYAKVLVRKGQSLQVSFEEAVKAKGSGFLKPSIEALNKFLNDKKAMIGSLFNEEAEFEWGIDATYSLDNLIADLQAQIK